ncbi:hypothetical protein GQ457_17G027590 [Hibiscus cannabinus]
MIDVFDDDVILPRNPRKHRRIDDDPPDKGEPATMVVSTTNPNNINKKVAHSISSYKESLMKDSVTVLDEADEIIDEEDIEIEEWEVVRSFLDGLISIDFSERILTLAIKSLDQTMVVKQLGRRIGYTILCNKVYELWKLSQPTNLWILRMITS